MSRALLLVLLTACEIGPAIYVERVGEGTGEITSDPEGLHCGYEDDCAMIVDDRVVTLTATPGHGSEVAGWSVEGCEGPTCTLTLSADTHVSARFELEHYPVTVTPSAGGWVTGPNLDCGKTCETTVVYGDRVDLRAHANPGMVFAGWRGTCAGAFANCLIASASEAISVEAIFEPRQKLHVTVVGNGTAFGPLGQECTSECSYEVDPKAIVTLRQQAAPGWVFAGWEGPCLVLPMGCQLMQNGELQYVTATFVPGSSVALDIVGDGSVAVVPPNIVCYGPCTQTYGQGTHVTLIPHANTGAAFLGWEGACTGTGNCELDANTPNVTVRARFAAERTLTVYRAGSGTITIAGQPACSAVTCTSTYLDGAIVTITAQPAAGFVFFGWSGACAGTGACAVTLSQDIVVQAQFVNDPNVCTQTVTADESAATFNARLKTPYTSICVGAATISGTVDVGANNVMIRGISAGARINGALDINAHSGVRVHALAILGQVEVNDSSVVIENSTIENTTEVLTVFGPLAHATVINTVMSSTFTHGAMSSNYGAYVELRNSQVTVTGFVLILDGGSKPSRARLDGNTFRKRAGSLLSYAPLFSNSNTNDITSSVPNTFCNEGTSTTDGEFVQPLVSGNVTSTWSFFSVMHNFQGNCQ